MTQSINQHLVEVLQNFDTAMLVTHTTEGATDARPMAIAELGIDAHMYFVTSGHSGKAAAILASPAVTIICQSNRQFVSLSGHAVIIHDPALVDRLWKDAWKLWFPKGKSDSDIAMIRFNAQEAEYWDNAGAQGIKYVVRAAKGIITGETPKTDEQQHAKILLDPAVNTAAT